ncbi:SynChlorMet cassette radical SAM/SPASM protein ScmF [candidate division KSB1 bacterium]|nr:SynChlorMet cassette radical SAM/SPASM protein ScmF [candidate division KSB1 bacterium]
MNTPASQNTWPLHTLYFYLTEGCNLACRHCWIAPRFQDEKHQYENLSYELFVKIIEQARPLGLSGVKLTGGEPLMHPQIGDLLVYIKKAELGLTVETNGVLCSPQLAEQMAACKNAFVSVSMDGVDAVTHEWVRGVRGCFDRSIEGIRNLTAVGLRPQIIMSIMRINVDQVEPMVRMAEDLGCGSVKFNLIQPTERGERIYEADQGLSIEEYIELGKFVENSLAGSSKIRLYYDQPMAFRPLNRMFGENGDGCSRCGILSILGVLHDGSYALCGIGTSVPEMVFGHAERDELATVWHESRILNDLRTGLPDKLRGICADCLMRNICLGSCVAQNYYRKKNIWASFWFCDEAYRKGLFPLGRAKKLSASF